MKRLALGLVTGAAALGLIAGTGVANAGIAVLNDAFPTTATYKDKKFNATVTNNSSKSVYCTAFFYESKDYPTLHRYAELWTFAMEHAENPTDEIPDDVEEIEEQMQNVKPIDEEAGTAVFDVAPNGGKGTMSWQNTTNKGATEVAVMQYCASTTTRDEETGFADMIVGVSTYKVGSGGVIGGDNGGAGGSMDMDGILDSLDLFGSLG